MSDNGVRPPESADKQLGEIVSDVTSKAQLLVREEIALAKAEVSVKVSRLVKGAVGFALAGFFALMMLIFLLPHAVAGLRGLARASRCGSATGSPPLLLVLTGLAALFGVRMMKKGSPPVPEMAIEEAQKTRAALKEIRS